MGVVHGVAYPVAKAVLAGCVLLMTSWSVWGEEASFEQAREWFAEGEYERALEAAEEALKDGSGTEEWTWLRLKALLVLGEYSRAEADLLRALRRHRRSLPLRAIGYEVMRRNGRPNQANLLLQQSYQLFVSDRERYREAEDLVAFGEALLHLGADARLVLENFFQRAKEIDPEYRRSYQAIGELALAKHDYELAAQVYQEGLEQFSDHPDFHWGVARAFQPSDRGQMLESLQAALDHNPRHLPSLLLWLDHQIDAEDYEGAEEKIEEVLEVNSDHPKAWAYRAVLAHLRGDEQGERRHRIRALGPWEKNPEVDHLIGRKLSQKYRFREGADYQQQALEFDSDYLPAKIQLAQDFLRLGEEEEKEGWRLAEEVHEADGYDIRAYNLVRLREKLADFETLADEHFLVRMDPTEARLYGDRVMQVLEHARTELGEKYGLEPQARTVVEIFPDQDDFGVRTFGMPENPGYLGVCFGDVVTMNSPASQQRSPTNWEAVLWHELCHVVTLNLTRNRMPRWLSEGISVFEERQRSQAWGQRMNPQYREMILNGELVPIQELSAAFLAPKSPRHLQFAYYEASLVVAFLVEEYGMDAVHRILSALGEGESVEQALTEGAAPLSELEEEFEAFARRKAENLAPELDWTKPEGGLFGPNVPAPIPDIGGSDNFWALRSKAQQLIEAEEWEAAKGPLERLIEAYPGYTGENNPYRKLAAVHRELGETEAEYRVLSELATRAGEDLETYARLMEIAADREDWETLRANAERYLAVQPLRALPFRRLGEAAEGLEEPHLAIEAYRRLLALDPADPAGVHFRLTRLLRGQGAPEAKRHLLKTLEAAPRFREAHRMLLEMETGQEAPAAPHPDSTADGSRGREKAAARDGAVSPEPGGDDDEESL